MTRTRTLLLAAGCTAAGALGAGAVGTFANGGHHHFGHHGMFGAVHVEAVVPTRGDDFATVVTDRGTVKDVSGDQLTVAVGTRDAIYRTETFTVPDGAKIHRWGTEDAKLSDLQAGDRVAVIRTPKKYVVLAAPAHADGRRH